MTTVLAVALIAPVVLAAFVAAFPVGAIHAARVKAEKAIQDAKFDIAFLDHKIHKLEHDQHWLSSRCNDTWKSHRCTFDIGHVGIHQDDTTAWYGYAEFPHPEFEEITQQWDCFNAQTQALVTWSGRVVKVVERNA